MNRRRFLCATGVLAATALTGCGGTTPVVRLAAGEVGGFYHAFATLLAATAAEAGTLRVEPVATNGSFANLAMLGRGEADAALALADSIESGADPGHLYALGRVYENYIQLAVRNSSTLRTVTDLRGARISLGAPGSGAAFTGERLLRAAGLDPATDIDVTHLALQDAVTHLAGGAIDALVWAGGVPTPLLDIPHTLRLIDLGELAQPMRNSFGYLYDRVVIPADAYPGAPATRTIGVANLLVTTRNLSTESAAALTELLISHADHLTPTEAAGTQFLDVRSLIGTDGLSLHPGAASVYRRQHG
jgi:uncharacterized protein